MAIVLRYHPIQTEVALHYHKIILSVISEQFFFFFTFHFVQANVRLGPIAVILNIDGAPGEITKYFLVFCPAGRCDYAATFKFVPDAFVEPLLLTANELI